MQITLTINTADQEELQKALQVLCNIAYGTNDAVLETTTSTPAKKTRSKKAKSLDDEAAEDAAVSMAEAEKEAAPKAEMEATAKSNDKKAADTKAEADKAAKAKAEAEAASKATALAEADAAFDAALTLNDVKSALKQYAALESKESAIKILKEIGQSSSINELDKGNYQAVIDACNA